MFKYSYSPPKTNNLNPELSTSIWLSLPRLFNPLIIAITLCATFLSGCGGGGGGDGGMSESQQSLLEVATFVQTEVAEAARSEPISGSVNQSSTGVDQMEVSLRTDGSQVPLDAIFNGVRQDLNDYVQFTPPRQSEPEEGSERGVTYTTYSLYTTEDFDNDPATDTVLLTDIITDKTGSNDTDYLVGGWWLVAPREVTNRNQYKLGVFMDGPDKFDQSNLRGLESTATYIGDVAAAYFASEPADSSAVDAYIAENLSAAFIEGRITLSANFGNASELGTISGRADNFVIERTSQPVAGNPILMFNQADIGGSNSGFFKGTTSMNYKGAQFSGRWGGQFFGNSAGSSYPGSVAGTFGGATSDNSASFLGIFIADHNDE